MKPCLPHTFRDDDVLSADGVNANFRQLEQDLRDADAVRFFHSQCRLEWGQILHSDAEAVAKRTLNLPRDAEITGVQIELFGDSAVTFALSVVGASAWRDIEATGEGSSTRVRVLSDVSALVALDDDIAFSFSSDAATWTINKAYVTVNWRWRRPSYGHFFTDVTVNDSVLQGFTVDNTLEQRMLGYTSEVANLRNTANLYRPSMLVIPLDAALSGYAAVPVPDIGRTVDRLQLVSYIDTGTLTATLKDDAADVQGTVTNNAPTTHDVSSASVAAPQGGEDVTDGSYDWSLEITSTGSPTVTFAYVVIYFR